MPISPTSNSTDLTTDSDSVQSNSIQPISNKLSILDHHLNHSPQDLTRSIKKFNSIKLKNQKNNHSLQIDLDSDDQDDLNQLSFHHNSNHYKQFGDMENEEILHSGYLEKKGQRRKTWKKRWFVLRKTSLVYYKNEKEYQLLRMIPLTEIHTCAEVQVKQHDNTFGIVTPTRTFYARAHSRIERDQWTKKVTDAKLQLKSLERSQLQILNELEPNLIDPLSQIQTSTHLQSINNHQIKLNHHHPTNLSPSSPQFPNSISINHQNITPIITTSINPSNSFVPSPSSSAISWVEEHQNDHHLGTITQASLKRAISSSKKKVKPIPIPSPNPSTSFSYHQSNKIISNETSPRARVDPSQQSFQLLTSSSEEEEVDDEVGLQHLIRRETCGTFTHDPSKIQPQAIQENLDSSRQTNVERKVSLPDACKPIIQGYLMKQGKRKTWRKRYFLLTSQKLVSSRSHMDITGRNSHIIPIARLLDAIEYEPSESLSVSTSILSSSVGATGGVGTSVASPSGTVAMGTATVVHSNNSTSNHGNLKVHEEHCFKIITSERTYLLSAPTEEEEIKWISAVKCLLTHYRANLPKPIGGGILDQRPGDKSPKQIMGQLNNELTKKT